MSNRIKLITPVINTRADMEALVGDIASLKIHETKLKAAMDQRLQQVREEYETDLGMIAGTLELKMQAGCAWAEAHPEEFGKARSITMVHGTVGWRIGMPQLKTLKGWTWKRVLENLIKLGYTAYVRMNPHVDKEAILANRENLLDGDLKTMGVTIVQEQSFYVEPLMQDIEGRVTTQTV